MISSRFVLIRSRAVLICSRLVLISRACTEKDIQWTFVMVTIVWGHPNNLSIMQNEYLCKSCKYGVCEIDTCTVCPCLETGKVAVVGVPSCVT